MALPPDQRALLQLLCERGQSYEDIGALLGTSTEEARAKARAALTEIGGADPDAEVGLTDYLLGQADPIGRADAVRHIQGDPETHALATRIEEGLREIAPSANLPKLPEPRGRARRAAVPAADEPSAAPARTGAVERGSGSSAGNRQTRLIAGIAAGGVVLLVAILVIAGVFGGSDEDDPATQASASTTTGADGSTTTAETGNERVTRVELAPSGGSGVAGSVDFGIANGNQLYADVQLNGLDPKLPRDDAVFMWLMLGEAGGYPISQPLQPVDANGRFSGRIAVPTAVAATVAGQARTVRISRSSIPELARAAQNAAEEQVPVVSFTGDLLADGEIPPAQGGG